MTTFISPVWIAFIVGLFTGAAAGIFILCLFIGGKNDEEMEEAMASQTKPTKPEEDIYYKYPVLKIPTGRRRELLIIGLEKAAAILENLPAIRSFVAKHAGKDAA